jgi:hypothetical protein
MAKKKAAKLEYSVQSWREVSLVLLLLLGIVGALSYVLLFRQKDQILLQDIKINRLQEEVVDLQLKSEETNLKKK